MKVLVAGGTGYIGSHICVELLQANHEVVVIDDFSNSKPEVLGYIKDITGKEVKFYEFNILDEKKTEEVSERTEEVQELNMEGTTSWVNESFRTRIFPYSGEKILEKKYTKWFDCDKINCELSVRTRRSGDYMIVNQSGGRKKLTRCMIDDKIPGEIRQEIPLVAAKDEVLWIVGGRISERYKITSQTEKVLEITYQGGNLE